MKRIIQTSDQLMNSRTTHVKSLASVAGQIIAMTPALGNVTRIMTRSMLTDIQSAPSWYSDFPKSEETKVELSFWKENLSSLQPVPMTINQTYHKVVYSDASNVGGAGYIVGVDKAVAHGAWDCNEKAKSSTWKELKAVQLALESFTRILAGNNVKWFTDSQNVAKIIDIGSSKPELQEMARGIYSKCVANGIGLRIEWIPRSQNDKADALSRIIDYDDWSLSHDLYHKFENLWGPHTIDRFANYQNNKLPRFNSRFWNPNSENIDALTETWSGENNWLVPPISLIAKTIMHLRASKAMGTLIIPRWLSAPFWPLLILNNGSFIPEIVDSRTFPASYDSFACGRSGRPLFAERYPKFNMLALRISFV